MTYYEHTRTILESRFRWLELVISLLSSIGGDLLELEQRNDFKSSAAMSMLIENAYRHLEETRDELRNMTLY